MASSRTSPGARRSSFLCVRDGNILSGGLGGAFFEAAIFLPCGAGDIQRRQSAHVKVTAKIVISMPTDFQRSEKSCISCDENMFAV